MVLFFAELVLKGLPGQINGARIGHGIDPVPGTRICFFKLPGSGGFSKIRVNSVFRNENRNNGAYQQNIDRSD
jgi:hypothetical protein